jgi:gliding motility-associated-like protein
MKNQLLYISVLILLFGAKCYAQGSNCAGAEPFCSNSGASFPASQNTTSQTGPNYGCLGSQPNPAWYYLQIGQTGNIIISLTNSANVDIDFIIWGPYSSLTGVCSQLTGSGSFSGCGFFEEYPCGNIIDCSFDPAPQETVTIPNAVVGQYYVLLITNYSNEPTNIFANQTGGTGATDCSIVVPCTITSHTNSVTACSISPALNYNVSGTVNFTDPPDSGQLIIQNCLGQQQVFNAPFGTSVNYSFNNVASDGLNCAYTATFSAEPTCTNTRQLLTPSPITEIIADCNPGGGGLSGSITFANGHPGANLIIQASDGVNTVQTSIPMPATSPQNFSLSGLSTSNLNYTLTYYFSDNSGCPYTASINCLCALFTLNSLNSVNESCVGSCNGSITINAPGAIQYSINNGQTFQAGNSFSNLCAGEYIVVAVDNLGCTASDTVLIESPAPVEVSVSGSAFVCQNTPTTFTTTTTGGSGNYTYIWNTGATTTNLTITPPSSQSYCVIATDANGCSSSQTCFDVEVALPMQVSASIDLTICPGQNANISATASGGDGGPYTYTWDNGAGNGQGLVVNPTVTTTYTVSATDNCGTTPATDQVTINVIPPPVVIITADTTVSCPPLISNFTATGVPAGSQCLWNFNNGFTSTNCGSAEGIFIFAGCYDISLTVTSTDGCINTFTNDDYVCVIPAPNLSFSYSPEVLTESFSTAYFSNTSSNSLFYLWEFDTEGAQDTSSVFNPVYTFPDQAGFYEVCISGATADCPAIYCTTIEVKEDFLVFVPNAFTPNYDDINDRFFPVVKGFVPDTYVFRIFDRWGAILFESTTPGEGWRGDSKGLPIPNDTYVWRLDMTDFYGEEHVFTGHVTIVR